MLDDNYMQLPFFELTQPVFSLIDQVLNCWLYESYVFFLCVCLFVNQSHYIEDFSSEEDVARSTKDGCPTLLVRSVSFFSLHFPGCGLENKIYRSLFLISDQFHHVAPVLRFGGPQKHLKESPIRECKNEMPGSFSFIQDSWQLHILIGSFQIDFHHFEQCILSDFVTLAFGGFWYIVYSYLDLNVSYICYSKVHDDICTSAIIQLCHPQDFYPFLLCLQILDLCLEESSSIISKTAEILAMFEMMREGPLPPWEKLLNTWIMQWSLEKKHRNKIKARDIKMHWMYIIVRIKDIFHIDYMQNDVCNYF